MKGPNIINPVSICHCTQINLKSSQIISSKNEVTIIYCNSLSQLKTTTTIACSRNFQQDRIWLNGKEEDISNPRLQSCLQERYVPDFQNIKIS